MKFVVIGGTGLIGSKLVKNLRAHGHEAVPASPDTGVNTLTGEGLTQLLVFATRPSDPESLTTLSDSDRTEARNAGRP